MKKSSRRPAGKGSGTRGPIHAIGAKSFGERQAKRDEKKKHGGKTARRDTLQKDQRTPRERPRRDEERPNSRIRVTLFGMHAVREAILNPEREIHHIYIGGMLEEDLQAILDKAEALGLDRPEPEVIDTMVLDRALPRGTVHQGIGCDAGPLPDVFLPDLINAGAAKERSVLVILDQVTDPHNMGAILRSACAFGADGVIVQSRHAPELGGVVAKTASGAVEHIPVAYETNLARTIDALKDAGYFVLALDERGAKTLPEAPSYDKTVLILGAEGPGLRPLIRERCDLLLRLPTAGGFSSLNVSNAAAVALYGVIAGRG